MGMGAAQWQGWNCGGTGRGSQEAWWKQPRFDGSTYSNAVVVREGEVDAGGRGEARGGG